MRALVLSGGGCKGAYQAGAISYLLGDRGVVYDIYCGVSVGALNSSALAMFPSGHERSAADTLNDIWTGIGRSSIKKRWNMLGVINSLWKPSVFDSSPLADLVRRHVDPQRILSSGKRLSVSAVSLATGLARTFTHLDCMIVDAVLASSSFPGMFKPIEIDGQLWSDGGLRNASLLKAAIDHGADAIDVIMTSPTSSIGFSDDPNVLDVVTRSLEIVSDEMMRIDLRTTQLVNRLVDAKRLDKKKVNVRVLEPRSRLPGRSLDFDKQSIRTMMSLGREDAKLLCEE